MQKVLVVKVNPGADDHVLWFLKQIEGVEVWEPEELEDFLFGKILESSDKGDYLDKFRWASIYARA